MESANGTAKPAKLRVTETDLYQVSQELNRAVGKESTCKQNSLVAASADRQAKALLEAATRNRVALEARYSDIVDRLGEQMLAQLQAEHGLADGGKLSPDERATAVAQGEATQRKYDPFAERGNDLPREAGIEITGDVSVAGTIGRLAADVANRFPVGASVRPKGKDGPRMTVVTISTPVGNARRCRVEEGSQSGQIAMFTVNELDDFAHGQTERMRIDDVAGHVEKDGKVEALDKSSQVIAYPVGAHAVLKSGGPVMTVEVVEDATMRLFWWADDGWRRYGKFGVHVLREATLEEVAATTNETARRRKFSELTSDEQEACDLIDGDQNPRYRLGDELIDSDRADGDQKVRLGDSTEAKRSIF